MKYERAFVDGSLASDEFVVASHLSMTVDDLRRTMPNNEFHQWRAFLVYRKAMQDHAADKARKR